MDSDEDAPPPLQSLAAQVQALQPCASQSSAVEQAAEAEDGIHMAVTTTIGPAQAQAQAKVAAAPALKRGFFDAKPTKRPLRNSQRHSSGAQASPPGKDVVTLIKAKPSAGIGAGVSIPDCMKLEPSEQERQYERYKSSLMEALKPTPDMVAKVSTNEQLMAGFDDPEVMAAVADVARDPSAMRKYANNTKVKAFYAAVGTMMGDKAQTVVQQHSSTMVQPPQQDQQRPAQHRIGT